MHKSIPKAPRKKSGKTGKLHNVAIDDLREPDRLRGLHTRAVATGVISASQADRLNFFTAACQARAAGRDAVRLFVWIVNGRHWSRLTGKSEDEAQAMLKGQTRRAAHHDYDEDAKRPDPVSIASIMAELRKTL